MDIQPRRPDAHLAVREQAGPLSPYGIHPQAVGPGSPRPHGIGGGSGGSSSPHELISGLWRRRWWIIVCIILAVGSAVAYILNAVPIYESRSKIYVEQQGIRVMSSDLEVMNNSSIYTQASLVKSTPILSKAVQHLGHLPRFQAASDPVDTLRKAVNVAVGTKDDLINVTAQSPFPAEAAEIVNAVVEAYIDFHDSKKRSTVGEVLEILRREKVKRDKELADKLERKEKFQSEHELLALERDNVKLTTTRLARISDELTEAELRLLKARAEYQLVEKVINEAGDSGMVIMGETTSGLDAFRQERLRLLGKIDDMRSDLNRLRQTASRSHPAVTRRELELKELESQLESKEREYLNAKLTKAKYEVTVAQGVHDTLEAKHNTLREQTLQLRSLEAEYAVLEADWEQTRKLVDILDNRIKELNVSENTGAMKVDVVDPAIPGRFPVKPNKTRTLVAAMIGGLLLGIGIAYLLELGDQRLRTPEEIAQALGLPVLGMVPQMAKAPESQLGRTVAFDPTSAAAEAFRTLRTAIHFGLPKGEGRVILVTSPVSGDGKSTLASNLAMITAQSGQRTLLIDADMRRPSQHKIFEFDPETPGLSTILSGNCEIDEAINKTEYDDLDVIHTGHVPPNPTELLNRDYFLEFLGEMRKRYDQVLIDCTPVLPVADARVVGAAVDATVLVLRINESTRRGAVNTVNALASVGGRILGVVVNAIPLTGGYGNYYRYHYGYGYRYEGQTPTANNRLGGPGSGPSSTGSRRALAAGNNPRESAATSGDLD